MSTHPAKRRVWVRTMLGLIADLGRKHLPRRSPGAPLETAIARCRDLLAGEGEASGVALAREIIELYQQLPGSARPAFFERLAREFGPDDEAVAAAARDFIARRGPDAYARLAAAVEPPAQELFRRLNMAPGATGAIVRMRQHLLGLVDDRPHLRPLEGDLRHLLNSWFNRGFLEFERIDWRTPAAVLEKLIEYEAVHEIAGWSDLRRRLDTDRRCFAFFHPALPNEPLIFLEVALTRGLPAAIRPLLDSPPSAGPRPDTAVFYSISNCQPGLVGISFGNFLIKQVVDAISADVSGITTFATLSPVPGFRRWLAASLDDPRASWLSSSERSLLSALQWTPAELSQPAVTEVLLRLCARYLVEEKRGGHAVDPVARFHLGNGASIERINTAADLSDKGLRQSAGLMVNYLYRTDDIVANHEAYVREGRIATSASVRRLLGRPRKRGADEPGAPAGPET
jgi:malonyl-CoA decarboxylase